MAGGAARAPPGSEARLSLAAFLLGASVLALPLLTRAGLQGRTALALYVAGLNALLLLLYRPPRYQVRAGRGPAGGPGGGRAGPGAGLVPRGAPWPESPGGGRDRASPGSGAWGRALHRRGGRRIAVGAVQRLRRTRVGWAGSELTSPFT